MIRGFYPAAQPDDGQDVPLPLFVIRLIITDSQSTLALLVETVKVAGHQLYPEIKRLHQSLSDVDHFHIRSAFKMALYSCFFVLF